MNTLTTVCALIALVGKASAWGNLGHETVGYVAQSFLAPNALSFVQSSLGSTYSESLGVAATVSRLISSTCLTRIRLVAYSGPTLSSMKPLTNGQLRYILLMQMVSV